MENSSKRGSGHPVLLVDDEEDVLFGSSYLLRMYGVKPVVTLQDARTLLPYLKNNPVSVVVLDLFMPHISGVELLPEIVRHHPEVPVVVMTASQEVDTAVSCMKVGAFDYLVKPVEESRFVSSVRRAQEVRSLRAQVGSLRQSLLNDALEHPEAFSHIVTADRGMETVFQYVEAIADSREPVLITGETGTGKELIAQAVHALSGRGGELVCLNAAGLDDNMFSDALFGHVKGAFTGAQKARRGLIAQAAGGTLFLDEIGDLGQASQVKLLRVLQDREYYPLGSDAPRVTDARIVAATNQPLQKRMSGGQFRQDLFFRLSSHPVDLPPLRERVDDIPILVRHFIDEAANAMGKSALSPPDELLTLLSVYHFPGNIRELRALIYDAVAQHRIGPVIGLTSFKKVMQTGRVTVDEMPSMDAEPGCRLKIAGRFPTLKEADDFLVREAMRRAKNNQGIAATLLGITRQSLNRRVQIMRRRS